MKRVQVHIERLVLRGVGGTAPAAVAEALRTELQQLLGHDGALAALQQGGHHARLRVADVLPGSAAAPAELGRQSARHICAGLVSQGGSGGRGRRG